MRIRSLFLVALSSLFLQVPLWAQGTGSIVGTVADETGGVLPGVTVHVHAGGVEQTTFTNGVGAYRFDGLPAGPAAIDFKLINFTVVYRDSTVVVGQMVTEDAVLSAVALGGRGGHGASDFPQHRRPREPRLRTS